MDQGINYYFVPSGQNLRTGQFCHLGLIWLLRRVVEMCKAVEGSLLQFLYMQNQEYLPLQCSCEAIRLPLTVVISVLDSFLLGKSIDVISAFHTISSELPRQKS